MQRLNKRGPPKHLERTLFINHKEDQMLDCRLRNLNLESRLKLMELDREKGKVRTELRNSRKKQITINEAISTGLMLDGNSDVLYGGKRSRNNSSSADNDGDGRLSSAPSQRKNGVVEAPGFQRGTSSLQQQKLVGKTSVSRPPTIFENEEYEPNRKEPRRFQLRHDSVGTYVLGEFEKISQVVPDILRALAKKKEKQQEADELKRIKELRHDTVVDMENIMEYEPDMNKVRKTVRAVTKLRHRMAMSKRLETPKHHKPLTQMIKDRTDSIGENNEYTDGTCALMKRRLEKKRRESEPCVLEPQFMQRRRSLGPGVGDSSVSRRQPEIQRRASSVSHLSESMTRSSTMLSLGSVGRFNSHGSDSDGDDSPFIDEDVLVQRQRIMKEINKYRSLQSRVDNFITSTACIRMRTPLRKVIIPLN